MEWNQNSYTNGSNGMLMGSRYMFYVIEVLWKNIKIHVKKAVAEAIGRGLRLFGGLHIRTKNSWMNCWQE